MDVTCLKIISGQLYGNGAFSLSYYFVWLAYLGTIYLGALNYDIYPVLSGASPYLPKAW
jgi:hypothetical protein